MSLYSQFETSKEVELEEGVRVEVPVPGDENAKFWVKRAGGANVAFTKFIEKENRKYRKANKAIDNETGQEILTLGLVHYCLMDWADVKDRDGKPLAFNEDNALKLFRDLPDLMMLIYNEASDAANFLVSEEQLEEEAGN